MAGHLYPATSIVPWYILDIQVTGNIVKVCSHILHLILSTLWRVTCAILNTTAANWAMTAKSFRHSRMSALLSDKIGHQYKSLMDQQVKADEGLHYVALLIE